MNTRVWFVVLLTGSLALALPASAQNPAETEVPPVLAARDLAPADLLAGPDFTVDETVPTDGFYAIFTVRGRYGAVQAHGVAMLRVRVAETQALARLKEVSRREAVVGGAGSFIGPGARALRPPARGAPNPRRAHRALRSA